MNVMNNSLWSDDEIEVSTDGFLLVKQPNTSSPDEEQPLLLHTTSTLLRSLYPSLSMKDIFIFPVQACEIEDSAEESPREKAEEAGSTSVSECQTTQPVDDEKREGGNGWTNIEPNEATVPAKYQGYQKLEHIENLPNQIHSALEDIRNYRHRTNRDQSVKMPQETEKVRALENEQERILKFSSVKAGGTGSDEGEPIDELSIPSGNSIEHSPAVKFARTINSVRALFPHLLPILNHPRRNDKNLIIGKTRYKTRRSGPMCWLLGKVGFGTSTCRQIAIAQENGKLILESFLGVDLASKIHDDVEGLPSFWSISWIQHLVQRSNPEVPSPLKVLASKSGRSERDIDVTAHLCDCKMSVREQSKTGVHQQYQKAVRKVHQRLSNVLAARFRGARLSIYGSCLSNLSLGKGSDVDMSLWIPEADVLKRNFNDGKIETWEYEKSMRDLVYQVCRKLRNLKAEFRGMTPIAKARIPVITGTYIYGHNPCTGDGSIDFDICFLNDIAVVNSRLLREYSLVDTRVRELMITVKQWAKDQNIHSAKDKYLSSYAWMNLVVFYLECVGFLPNLQSPILMEAADLVPDPEKNYWHFVNNLNTCILEWETIRVSQSWTMPDEFKEISPSLLLYGFFEFYNSRFPSGTHAVSIRRGNMSVSKVRAKSPSVFISIEDPFETFDSHLPHDLSSPVDRYGSTQIRRCFRDAEEYLRNILCSETQSVDRLWPDPPLAEPAPTKGRTKKSGFKRFARTFPVAKNLPTLGTSTTNTEDEVWS